jgi:predicted Zn-dependent protease
MRKEKQMKPSIKMLKHCSPTLPNRTMFLLIIAHVLLAGTKVCAERAVDTTEESVMELKDRAARVMRLRDNVEIRGEIEVIWALVDRLRESGATDEVLKYLVFGLKHDPWALKYQLWCAKLLASKGENEKAKEKAEVVFEYAETDALLNEARALLKKEPPAKIPKLKQLETAADALVLVPLGKVDVWLMWKLRDSLQESLGIPVHVQDAKVPMPAFKRDRLQRIIKGFRERLLAQMGSAELKPVLAEMQVNREKLKSDEVVLDVLRKVTEMSGGRSAVNRLNEFLEQSKGADKQWDIDDLLKNLGEHVHEHKRPRVSYMGVANVDAYWHDSNFIFGVGLIGRGYGVITYRRFTADFNEETPKQQRLVSRTLKQALSTAGFMYGIERCSNPTCARAYPNSLPEHDAKSTKLCATCRKGFQKVFSADSDKK